MTRNRPHKSTAVKDALQQALTRERSPLAHDMALRQREQREGEPAVRMSPGYERFLRSKAKGRP